FVPNGFSQVSSIWASDFVFWAIRAPFAAESMVSPQSVPSGNSSVGTVTLKDPAPAGGAVVSLSTSDPVLHVPAFVTVPEGETTASFGIAADAEFFFTRFRKVFTTYAGETHEAFVRITTGDVILTTTRSTLVAGSDQSLLVKVTFNGPMTVPIVLDVSAPAGIRVPATVRMPAGKTSVSFRVTADADAPLNRSYIWVGYQGNDRPVEISVVPLQATLSLSSGYAGQVVTGLVKLNAGVTVDTIVPVSTDDPAMGPYSVTIAPGTNGSAFSMYLPIDATTHKVVATASLNGMDSVKVMTVTANDLSTFTLSASSIRGGNPTTGTVSIRYPVTVDTTVTLVSNKSFAAAVPATVTILAGSKSVTFPITTFRVGIDKLVKFTASRNGKALSAYLTVTH
ncbi:MAG: hypothetical protein ACAH95_17100, partial [Fimbriimonas sp.]